MSKNKKIILISAGILIILVLGGYFIYQYFNKPDYAPIEQAGLNNISGVIKSVEGSTLKVLAQVPNKFTPFSEGNYEYINREYTLKTTASTTILAHIKENTFEQLMDLKTIKPNTGFSAVSQKNIMDSNELEIVELIIYK